MAFGTAPAAIDLGQAGRRRQPSQATRPRVTGIARPRETGVSGVGCYFLRKSSWQLSQALASAPNCDLKEASLPDFAASTSLVASAT